MWLSELEKGMTVWFFGMSDDWNVYSATVVGWTAEHVVLEIADKPRFTRKIAEVSAEPLQSRPVPEGVISVQDHLS